MCGANICRNAKTTQLVSGARESNGSKIVSVSDKVFGLLLIDNYLEKCKVLAEEEAVGTKPTENNNTTMEKTETGSRQGKHKKTRRTGMYTKKCGTMQVATVSGAKLELASSIHCARWLKKTGHVQRLGKWKGS